MALSAVATLAYFLLVSRDYSSVWPSDYHSLVTFFIAVDFLCCTLPFILSIFYHTFMCHSSGQHTYKQLLKLDIFGVWLTCTFGPISHIYTALYCLEMWRHLYLLLYMSISFVVLYYLLVVDCKQRRVVVLTVQFVFLVFIHLIRLTPLASTDPETLKYYLIMDAMSVVGGTINAFHIPERWAPGKLDYVFNGHSLMHIVAFVALAVGRQGFLLDMVWLNSGAKCS